MVLAVAVAILSIILSLLMVNKKERKSYCWQLCRYLLPTPVLLLLRSASGTRGSVFQRLEEHRRTAACALQREMEVLAHAGGVEVIISSLSGGTWHTLVGPHTTGMELKLRVAHLAGLPLREVRLVAGVTSILDNVPVLESISGADMLPEQVEISLLRVHQQRVLSGSADGSIRLSDYSSGCCLASLRGHTKRASCLAVDWDRRCALSASADSTMCLWDLDAKLEPDGACGSLEPVEVFRGTGSSLKCLSVDWHTRQAMVAGGTDIELWDLDRSVCLLTFRGHIGGVQSLSVDWNARLALSGTDGGSILLWDFFNVPASSSRYLSTNEKVPPLTQLDGHLAWVVCVELEPQRLVHVQQRDAQGRAVSVSVSLILTGSMEGLLKLWELRELKPELDAAANDQRRARLNIRCAWTVQGGWGDVRCASVHWQSLRAITGAAGGALKLWDLRNGHLMRTFWSGHGHGSLFHDISSIAVDWPALQAMSGSAGGYLNVWDLATFTGTKQVVTGERSTGQRPGELSFVILEPSGQVREALDIQEPEAPTTSESSEDDTRGSDLHAVEEASGVAEGDDAGGVAVTLHNVDEKRCTIPVQVPLPQHPTSGSSTLLMQSGHGVDRPHSNNVTCASCCHGLQKIFQRICGLAPRRNADPSASISLPAAMEV
eukprot:TRINITY_DN9356_c0_g1_i2.p1 TRINITY_DN9356_c0_g1~~TRINITY_DN9356_c0_g1_i2.p1  ORF type:complete len:694 (+),score=95.17 TRINITY_DN9356_c0_g1_i2:104-2083(+)